jgi:hypothetical protein
MEGNDQQGAATIASSSGFVNTAFGIYIKFKLPLSIFFYLFHVLDIASDITMCYVLRRDGN